ncbi:MAG: hypothetical protein IT438_11700 [Phycisphaerales bacterium]|nr:hypothetical protein [Phycisphaerales bacterium]
MPELKPIEKQAIPRALAKAERYRFLNEPREAESIARDILAADPASQAGIAALLLALTDRFEEPGARPEEPRALAAGLADGFERAYFAGVVEERWAKALHDRGYARADVLGILGRAMAHFEAADGLAPAANDDAALRWNSCVRMIRELEAGSPALSGADDDGGEGFDDEVPSR